MNMRICWRRTRHSTRLTDWKKMVRHTERERERESFCICGNMAQPAEQIDVVVTAAYVSTKMSHEPTTHNKF